LASWSSTLSELQAENTRWRWIDTHIPSVEQIKELVNSPQILKPCNPFWKELKYLIRDGSDIGLGSWIGLGKIGSI